MTPKRLGAVTRLDLERSQLTWLPAAALISAYSSISFSARKQEVLSVERLMVVWNAQKLLAARTWA